MKCLGLAAAMIAVFSTEPNASQPAHTAQSGWYRHIVPYQRTLPVVTWQGHPGGAHKVRNARRAATPSRPANTSVDTAAVIAASTQISITGRRFFPATVRIRAGDAVTWINQAATLHALTSPNNGSLASATLTPGSRYSHTFDKPGVYVYYCALNTTMFGRVIVD